ncbi:M90 family metallopeptidase [Microbulbifer agarilyticus]|uniref:M90 family metallopeptidase n=1 Tax=Microbulbifer agarilyticus TaxID=260552 RepID=UPI001CD55914|nr:M90 family metallopeptidase [Microbulbifer agarilyticus]MCA0895054.1 zinc-dependent peptidase [Microbulbifer agarilyticus]
MDAFLVVILIAVLAWVVPFLWQRWRREYLRSRPLSTRQERILADRLALFRYLPADRQQELKENISLFLRDKEFVGCNGQVITEDIRVTIAAHACLLLLERPNNCYPDLKTVLVYPDAYVARETRHDGHVQSSHMSARAGEAHYRGPVVLSWGDLVDGMQSPQSGHNVAIHEFAHKLDEEDGYVDGRPPFENSADGKTWAPVMREAFTELRQRIQTLHAGTELAASDTAAALGEKPSVLDTYGAQSPAEFFAVATEAFFIIPTAMESAHPALYREMQKFFRTDPAALLRGNRPDG